VGFEVDMEGDWQHAKTADILILIGWS
jgi:hypothetical protein